MFLIQSLASILVYLRVVDSIALPHITPHCHEPGGNLSTQNTSTTPSTQNTYTTPSSTQHTSTTPSSTSTTSTPSSSVSPTSTSIPSATNSIQVTRQEILSILSLHNIERQLLNLTDIRWSYALQSNAQSWSNELSSKGCGLEHFLESGSSGQNLYAGYGWTIPNYTNAVNAWISEKALVSTNASFSEIGHYLIIISPNFLRVGCASSINTSSNCFVVTCDYGL